MAIQYMENFQAFGSGIISANVLLDGLPWAIVGDSALVPDPDTAATGNVLAVGNTPRLALPTVVSSCGSAQRWWASDLPVSPTFRFGPKYRAADTTTLYWFALEPNGALSLYRGGTTLVATTTNPVINPRSWFHWETFCNPTTGEYEARIEGVPVLSGTDSSPPGGSIGLIDFTQGGLGGLRLKDLVIWDETGSQNNSFVGTVTVYLLPVNEDISSGWTKSTGTSDYQLLDEIGPNDTDYISADTTLPAASIMGFGDLPDTVVGVRAVQTMVRAKKSDGGDATLVVSLISGSDEAPGLDHYVTTASKYWFDVQELDPATATLWAPLDVNDAQIKIDRTV